MNMYLSSKETADIPEMIAIFREQYFAPAIQRLASTFCITTEMFYDTIFCYQLEDYEYIDYVPKGFDAPETAREVNRTIKVGVYNKKLKRLISTLRKPDSRKESSFFCEKFYDEYLEKVIYLSYKAISPSFDFPELNRWVPAKLLYNDNMSTISLNAGYAIPLCLLDRNGFSFIEYILLSGLFLSVRSGSLKVLNKPITTKDQVKNAYKRFVDFYGVIHSPKMYSQFLHTIHEFICNYALGIRRTIYEKNMRAYWIEEGFEDLKYTDYAIDHHCMLRPRTLPNDEDMTTFIYETNMLEIVDWFIEEVYPIAELVGKHIVPDDLSRTQPSDLIDIRQYIINADSSDNILKWKVKNDSSCCVRYADYLAAKSVATDIEAFLKTELNYSTEILRVFEEYSNIPVEISIEEYMKANNPRFNSVVS